MRLRLIAFIIAFIAAGLTAFNIFWKPEDYSAVIATCRNDQNKPEVIIQACSELIGVAGISDYNLNLFLRYRAWAFDKKGDYETALEDIDRAMKVMPESDTTWVWRAFIHNAHGDYDATAEDFEHALAISSDRAVEFENRADLFYRREKYEQALQDYQRVLVTHPKYKPARERVVTILLMRGEIDQAIAVLDQAIALYPNNPELYLELGKLHFTSTGDYQQALKALLRSDELDPKNSEILMYLGGVYFHLGDGELGKSYIEEASIAARENLYNKKGLPARILYKLISPIMLGFHGERYVSQGLAYAKTGQPDLARLEFDSLIEKGGVTAFDTLRNYMRKYGFCSGPCLREGEGGEFYQELDRFIASMDFSFKGVVQSEDP